VKTPRKKGNLVALTTYEEIKNQIQLEFARLIDDPHADDQIAEMASANVPIFDQHIIQEWRELSTEDSDQWKELGYDTQRNEGGIVSLMAVDLEIYYLRRFDHAWKEIRKENL
jgi:hypothetical protein